jgi:hypothetical protein
LAGLSYTLLKFAMFLVEAMRPPLDIGQRLPIIEQRIVCLAV